jgi:hypothetical protein
MCRVSVIPTLEDAIMAKPAYRAYTVIKRDDKDDYWLNVGACYPHDDGDGFNLLLNALPVDGKLVLRTYKEKPEEQEKIIKGKFKK